MARLSRRGVITFFVTAGTALVRPRPAAARPAPPLRPGNLSRIGIDTAYSSTPSVTRLPDGRLRLVWFQGNDHFSYGTSRVMTATSPDHGGTWTPATEVPGLREARDPNISVAADGTVWLSYFLATATLPACGAFVRRSTDGGATFGPPVRVDPGLPYAACSAPVRDQVGALWLPYYGRAAETRDSAYLARSTDGGATWESGRIADGPADALDYNEPWLVAGDGPLVVMHRYGGWSQIGVTRSTTLGATWTGPRPAFPGTGRPAAARTAGRLLVVYRDTKTRSAHYALSPDDGATWPHHGVPVLQNAQNSQFGMVYASLLELSPGTVYCVVAMEDGPTRCALWHGTFT